MSLLGDRWNSYPHQIRLHNYVGLYYMYIHLAEIVIFLNKYDIVCEIQNTNRL